MKDTIIIKGPGKMKKVIVTGANGFVGRELLRILSDRGIKVYAIIRDREENIEKIRKLPNISIVYCEMEHIEMLPEMIKDRDIDVCFHLAWAGSFGDSRADYLLQLRNIEYSMRMVEVMAQMRTKRFVGAGTLAEKDVLNYHPTDGAAPNVVSIYGTAKIATHFMTKAECTKLGVEHIWCYLSNTFGVGNTTNNFVNMAVRMMLEGKKAEFTPGEQIYDFMYITDTAKAIYAAAEKGNTNTAYYLGSGKQRKLKEYVRIIRDAVDPDIPLYFGAIPFRGITLSEESYDASKLMDDTGFCAEISFEDGITKTINWLKEEGIAQDATV